MVQPIDFGIPVFGNFGSYRTFYRFDESNAEVSTNQRGLNGSSDYSDRSKFQRSFNRSRKKFYRIGSWLGLVRHLAPQS